MNDRAARKSIFVMRVILPLFEMKIVADSGLMEASACWRDGDIGLGVACRER